MNWTPRNGKGPLVRQYGTDFCPLAMWIAQVMRHAFPEIVEDMG